MGRIFTEEEAQDYLEEHIADERDGRFSELVNYYYELIPPHSLEDYGDTKLVQVANYFLCHVKGEDVLNQKNILAGGGLFRACSDIMGVPEGSVFTIVPLGGDTIGILQPGVNSITRMQSVELLVMHKEKKLEEIDAALDTSAHIEKSVHMSLKEAVVFLNKKFSERGINGTSNFLKTVDELFNTLPNKPLSALTQQDRVIIVAENYHLVRFPEKIVEKNDVGLLQTGSVFITQQATENFQAGLGCILYLQDRYKTSLLMFELSTAMQESLKECVAPLPDKITCSVGGQVASAGNAGRLLASIVNGGQIRSYKQVAEESMIPTVTNAVVNLSTTELIALINGRYLGIIPKSEKLKIIFSKS